MPNQNNFRSDITTVTDTRFNASRIVRYPEEGVLNEEVPASFGFDTGDNIELHFYTIPGNQLLLSVLLRLDDNLIKSHVVTYSDTTNKNYIRIDFSEIFRQKNLILVPGDYRMVMNFFSDEIGSYDNRKLSLTTISSTREEVELTFNDSGLGESVDVNQTIVYEFVEPYLDKIYAVGAAEKIFKSGVQLDDEEEGLLIQNILDEEDVELLRSLNIYDNFVIDLHAFLLQLGDFIKEDIIIYGDELIQKDQYQNIIIAIVREQIRLMQLKYQAQLKIL